MNWDERTESSHYADSLAWASSFNSVRGPGVAAWISTFRDDHPSEVVGDNCGSFNWSCKVRFDDGVEWMVRFAVSGRVIDGDEKIRHEVATMQFLRSKTSIPVPSIIAWGLSHDNPLGFGAFIITEYIDGEPLDKVLVDTSGNDRILRSDISDRDLEIVYRQIANILLELAAHDLPQIGSLFEGSDYSHPHVNSRPFTLRMNKIECHGGVRVGSHVSRTFSSASECFLDIAEQDMQHLHRQPNSIDDEQDARQKYIYNQILRAMIPHFVSKDYDAGPFKLICDDFRLGNILVNNARELKIVAVLDWEWSYAAPYQMLFSPPRWLLIKKPFDWDDAEMARYKILLSKFVKILDEEERKRGESAAHPRMADLMQQSLDDGKFWFHELVYSCFESPDSRAWDAIRELFPGLDKLVTIPDQDLDEFVKSKLEQLSQYNIE